MRWAGVDGAKGGWVCALGDSSGVHRLFAVTRLTEIAEQADLIAVDMPIGLPESGRRRCDVEVRAALPKERRSSLFPVCVRAALRAETYGEACALARAAGEPCPSLQLFHLRDKILELENLALARPNLAFEVFPEWSFILMGKGAVAPPKKTPEGAAVRQALIAENLGKTLPFEPCQGVRASRDDQLDALAAFWTACRLASGQALCLPEEVELDAKGLAMRIHA